MNIWKTKFVWIANKSGGMICDIVMNYQSLFVEFMLFKEASWKKYYIFKEHLRWYCLFVKTAIFLFIRLLLDWSLVLRAVFTAGDRVSFCFANKKYFKKVGGGIRMDFVLYFPLQKDSSVYSQSSKRGWLVVDVNITQSKAGIFWCYTGSHLSLGKR